MRLRGCVLVLCLMLLLTGCAGLGHDRRSEFLRMRAKLLESPTFSLSASLRADYGERVYDFRLRYEGDERGGTLTVEEPLSIAGVEALISENDVLLRFEDFSLDTGAILGRLSPLEAFPLLICAWRTGSVTEAWREDYSGKACLVADIDLSAPGEEEKRSCRTWFDTESLAPLHSEVYADGTAVLLADFSES